ncbi:MAG: monovalent cation/H(+) antiporter subunit G [Candidatus Methanomethylicia archaeon]|nr:monovalent cation/H(+) antiporter subunit G [Candidatus Methanomethylicia archaeon]
MIQELFVLIYAALIMGYVAWNIRKGSFVIDPSKLVLVLFGIFLVSVAGLMLLGSGLSEAASIIMKIGAAGVMFAGVIPMVAASVGLMRFGEEYGPNIFYARNHITGVVDTTASLVMIFAGILIYRLDLVAVGFFFFMFIPFVGNALANAYYYNFQRRLEK